MREIPIGYYSLAVLKEPEGESKGAVILSQVDDVILRFPFIKLKFDT
jgi:hypothetical protein